MSSDFVKSMYSSSISFSPVDFIFIFSILNEKNNSLTILHIRLFHTFLHNNYKSEAASGEILGGLDYWEDLLAYS